MKRFYYSALDVLKNTNGELAVVFCCAAMKDNLYSAKYVFDGKNVRLWGESERINQCPYCGNKKMVGKCQK